MTCPLSRSESTTAIVHQALELLRDYLSDFPEHDQGDLRVWEAAELLEGVTP